MVNPLLALSKNFIIIPTKLYHFFHINGIIKEKTGEGEPSNGIC